MPDKNTAAIKNNEIGITKSFALYILKKLLIFFIKLKL